MICLFIISPSKHLLPYTHLDCVSPVLSYFFTAHITATYLYKNTSNMSNLIVSSYLQKFPDYVTLSNFIIALLPTTIHHLLSLSHHLPSGIIQFTKICTSAKSRSTTELNKHRDLSTIVFITIIYWSNSLVSLIFWICWLSFIHLLLYR